MTETTPKGLFIDCPWLIITPQRIKAWISFSQIHHFLIDRASLKALNLKISNWESKSSNKKHTCQLDCQWILQFMQKHCLLLAYFYRRKTVTKIERAVRGLTNTPNVQDPVFVRPLSFRQKTKWRKARYNICGCALWIPPKIIKRGIQVQMETKRHFNEGGLSKSNARKSCSRHNCVKRKIKM